MAENSLDQQGLMLSRDYISLVVASAQPAAIAVNILGLWRCRLTLECAPRALFQGILRQIKDGRVKPWVVIEPPIALIFNMPATLFLGPEQGFSAITGYDGVSGFLHDRGDQTSYHWIIVSDQNTT